MVPKQPPAENVLGYTIAQAAKASGAGRSTLYVEMKEGRLKARKLGRRTIVLASDLAAWLAALPTSRP